MPVLTRLHLSTTSERSQDKTTHVFDVSSAVSSCRTLSSVRDALKSIAELPEASTMLSWLSCCLAGSSAPANSVEVISLPDLNLEIHEATELERPGRLLQEGAAKIFLEAPEGGTRKLLKTPLRALRAQTIVDGVVCSLVALVREVTIPPASPLAGCSLFCSMHFIGTTEGELVPLNNLMLGKRSSVVLTHGVNASYFLRRQMYMKEHMAAMQNFGAKPVSTNKIHNILLDAYVSQVQHKDRKLQCLSVFI